MGLALFIPLGLLGITELALRLGGYGFATAFWVADHPTGQRVTNDDFARQFFSKQTVSRPFYTQLKQPKTPGAIRIFLLGESAAMGAPDPAFGPARMLEVMLRQQYPQRQIEVVNAAMRGIDSHVVRRIAQDCAELEPDLFIIFTGNNEGVGLHAPGPDTAMLAMDRRVIRLSERCKATRTGQFVRQSLASRSPPKKQDMDFFRKFQHTADDPRMDQLRDNFAINLREICALGNFPKILATVPVNLLDCPPLGSQHRGGFSESELANWKAAYDAGVSAENLGRHAEAVQHFAAAMKLDAQFADLHYRLGRCHLALGDATQSRRHLELARDWDTLPFRADRRLNAIVRRVSEAARAQSVSLCDAEAAFTASDLSVKGLPGARLFHEHVHTTFEGTWLLARTFFGSVTNVLAQPLGAAAGGELPSVADCARQLAFTVLDEYNVAVAINRLTAGPPFLDQVDHAERQAASQQNVERLRQSLTPPAVELALATYQAAIRRRPEDWMLRFNLGNLLLQLGQNPASLEQFAWLAEHHPRQPAFHKTYGNALIQQGQSAQALAHLEAALKLAPHDAEVREWLARARGK